MVRQAEDSTPGNSANDAGNTMTLVLGIVDFSHYRNGLVQATDHLTRVQLPSRLSTEDVQRMGKDFELLAAAFREHPTEMTSLLEAHFRKDTNTSRQIADTLGLSEEAFKAQGGGIIWGVVGALVVCDVFTGCLTSWAWNGV